MYMYITAICPEVSFKDKHFELNWNLNFFFDFWNISLKKEEPSELVKWTYKGNEVEIFVFLVCIDRIVSSIFVFINMTNIFKCFLHAIFIEMFKLLIQITIF